MDWGERNPWTGAAGWTQLLLSDIEQAADGALLDGERSKSPCLTVYLKWV